MDTISSDSDTIPVEQDILDVLVESGVEMPEQTKQHLVDFMVEMGAFSVEDMIYIKDEDLSPFLLPIQRRKLLECIKQKFKNEKLQGNVIDCNSDAPLQTTCTKDDHSPQFSAAVQYKLNEEKIPNLTLKCLQEKKRLTPSERRLFVRIISDDISTKFTSPGRKILRIVASNVVLKYPKSLADFGFNGEFLGDGCGSFILQLENSLSNSRRQRQKRSAESSSESETSPLRKRQDCNVSQLPQDELESYRVALVAKFQTGSLGSLDEEATALLQRSFTGLRSVITSQKYQITDLLVEWPILFTKDGFSVHFKQLVGKSIIKLTENMHKMMPNFQLFMQSMQIKNKDIKTVIKEISAAKCTTMNSQPDIIGMIALLCHYFGENLHTLILKEGDANLPVTPCIICKGSTMYTAATFDIVVDKQVIMKNVTTAANAIATVFASFYVFDIEYPLSSAITLEFFQWSIAEIRPRGIKTEKAGKNKSRMNGIHAKVLTLTNNINDFCAL